MTTPEFGDEGTSEEVIALFDHIDAQKAQWVAQEKQMDELHNELIDHEDRADQLETDCAELEGKLQAARKSISTMLDAIGHGSVQSAEIDLGDGTQPHKFHEEWAYHARAALSDSPPPDPVREAAPERAICRGKGYVESVEHVTPCMTCFWRDHPDLTAKYGVKEMTDAIANTRPEAAS